MEAGRWFKESGSGPVEYYYHVIDANDEEITSEWIEYNRLIRQIRGSGRSKGEAREFREMVLSGARVELPRAAVPFLLAV